VSSPSKYRDLTLYRRLLQISHPYWIHIVVIFLLSLSSIPLQLLNPIPLKIAVDSVLGSQALPGFLRRLFSANATQSLDFKLFLAAGLFVGISLLSYLQEWASSLIRTYAGEKLVLQFRAQLFRRVQRLALSYHDSKGRTDSIYRIQYDAPAIQYIAIDGVIPFISASFTVVGMICVSAQIDWQLALVAISVSPFLFMLSRAARLRLREGWSQLKSLQSSAMSVVQEVLAAVQVVKGFGRERYEENRFVRHSRKTVWEQIRLTMVEGKFNFIVGMIIACGTAATLLIGVRHVQSGVLTLGGLLIIMAYLAQLYEPLKTIGRKVASLQSHLASAERAFALLDEAAEVNERPHARSLARAMGAVVFQDVSFTYATGHQALRDISFRTEPGTRLGIAGKTGAGKTTLVSLLLRFYDPSSGRILLDGLDLRDYRLEDLRNQFTIVHQESILFATSIAENIAYARPSASEAEIIAAAKAANAHDFILGLGEGYETQVGERGMLLSGGERQRIALARAFLKDAPILILDEPTSAIDTETEAAIMDSMTRLMSGRTTFLITHRRNTLTNCDRVISIEHGELVSASGSESRLYCDV